MQAEYHPVAAPGPRMRVVMPVGLFLFVGAVLLRWPDQQGAVLDLEPYLPGPRPAGLVADGLRDLATRWPWVLAFLAGACCLLSFLALEGLIRAVWKHAFEAAAALPAVAFAVLPAQTAFHRVAGGETLLLGLTLSLAAARLALGARRGPALAGALLGALSASLHPACWALVPCVVACLLAAGHLRGWRAGLASLLGTMIIGYGAFLLGGGVLPAPVVRDTLSGIRPALVAEQLAASPILATWSRPRDLLPTGYEALAGSWPIPGGLLVWGLLMGWGSLVAGTRRSVTTLALAAVAGSAPWIVPGWIPGERALALLPLIPALGLLSLVLGVIRGAGARNVSLGVALGLFVWFGWQSELRARAGQLSSRAVVFELPREAIPGGQDFFAPILEPDPVRLVLFAHDLAQGNGTDPYLFTAGDAAAPKITPTAPVVDPVGLERLRKQAVRDQNRLPSDLAPGEERLFEEILPPLEDLVRELVTDMAGSDPELWYDAVQRRMVMALPEAMEILQFRSRHPRVQYFTRTLYQLLRRLAASATESGDLQYSVPLREALVLMTEGHPEHHPKARAILGIELTDMRRYGEALEQLSAAIPALDRGEVLGAVARGTVGRCLMARGERRQALEKLNDAWSGLVGGAGGDSDALRRLADPRSRDYWLVVELLLLRYELVRELDLEFEPQAARDLDRALSPALNFGARTVPALAFKGRFEQLRGEPERARRFLEELRDLKVSGLIERVQRLAHSRYRLLGLRTLLELLGPGEASQRAGLEAEIAELDRY